METLLFLDQISSTIKSDTTIVTDDTPTSIRIRQTSDNVSMTSSLDVIIVSSKHTLIVSLTILSINLLSPRVQLIAISLQRSLHHTNTTLREDTTLQRSISLHTHDDLIFLVDITRSISINTLRQSRLNIINTLLALYLKHLRELIPQLLRLLRCRREKTLITIIGLIVVLNKITHINLMLP